MPAQFFVKFTFNCCWLLAVFAVVNISHVSSADDGVKQTTGHTSAASESESYSLKYLREIATLAESSSTSAHLPPVLAEDVLPTMEEQPPSPPHDLNIYPLSNRQFSNGLKPETMRARILAQMENGRGEQGQRFHPQLLDIVHGYCKYWPRLFNPDKKTMKPTTTVKPWSLILRDVFEKAIDCKAMFFGMSNAHSTDLIEVLVTTTNAQKLEMGLYSSDFCDRMCKHPELAKNPRYRTLMWSLCKLPRDEAFFQYDGITTNVISDTIDLYLKKEEEMNRKKSFFELKSPYSNKFTEASIGRFLARTNYTQLRHAFDEFPSFKRRLEERKNDPFWKVIYSIYLDVQMGRPHFFASLLHEKLHKLENGNITTNDADAWWDVARILITRAQIDLPDIVDAYDDVKPGKKAEPGMLQTLLLFRLHEKFTNNLDARAQVDAYIAIVKLVKQWEQRERDEARGTTRTKY